MPTAKKAARRPGHEDGREHERRSQQGSRLEARPSKSTTYGSIPTCPRPT